MKTKLTLRRLFVVVAVVLGCTLVILSMATLVAANGGGVPTVDGKFTGDEANYKVLGSAAGNRGTLYYNRTGNTLYLAVVVSTTVNDNVFGDHNADADYLISADWTTGGGAKNHGFGALLNSDNTEFHLECGSRSWTWKQGYLYKDGDEWKSDHLDGSLGGGTPPPTTTSHSSLEWNLENTTWDVTLAAYGVSPPRGQSDWISPGEPASAPTAVLASYPGFDSTYNWEWAMVYETSVDVSACGSDDITVFVPSAHNSPPKDGTEDVPICPDGCPLSQSITIIKEVYSFYGDVGYEDDQEFNFTGDLGEFILDDYTVSGTPKSITFSTLNPGTYSVTETLPTDWDITGIVCDDDNSSGAGAVATIQLESGEHVTCTFNNAPLTEPTAVTLSTFAAKSSAGGLASPLWLELAGLTVLAAGSLFWAKRRAG